MASTLVEITVLLLVLVLPLFGPAKKRRKKWLKTSFPQKYRVTELMRRENWSYLNVGRDKIK